MTTVSLALDLLARRTLCYIQVDGIFGPRDEGLAADGVVGLATWAGHLDLQAMAHTRR